MKTETIISFSGRFYVTLEDLKRIKAHRKGLNWALALDDFLDPIYCQSILKITRLTKNRSGFEVEGTIVYRGEPRKFNGKIKPVTGRYKPLECNFKSTERAVKVCVE